MRHTLNGFYLGNISASPTSKSSQQQTGEYKRTRRKKKKTAQGDDQRNSMRVILFPS